MNNIALIGTCPMSGMKDGRGTRYLQRVAQAAQWADADGWDALLVYSDHRQVDPWIISQFLLQHTARIHPLVAVQPLYAHPYTVAKTVRSLSYLYSRRIYLNFVAGGFPQDLESFCDPTPHDERYERLVEYGQIITQLLYSDRPVSFKGKFFQTERLQLVPRISDHLFPVFTVSGSSEAGLSAARRLGARAIQYLRPLHEYENALDSSLDFGTRLGIIVKDTRAEAWSTAYRRYPETPGGRRLRKHTSDFSDSQWIKDLNQGTELSNTTYWLGPYKNFQSSCPFLVGDWDDVTTDLARYLQFGFRTYLIERPADAADSKNITKAFSLAYEKSGLRADAR